MIHLYNLGSCYDVGNDHMVVNFASKVPAHHLLAHIHLHGHILCYNSLTNAILIGRRLPNTTIILNLRI